MKLKEKFS